MNKTNLNIRINLTGFQNAGVVMLQGKTGMKKCVVIPIEENHLYQGNKGVYADFVAWTNDKLSNGSTHLIKQSFTKEVRDAMTEDQRMSQPTFGDVRPMVSEVEQSAASVEYEGAAMVATDSTDDLPF